jgi:hypothetical protein
MRKKIEMHLSPAVSRQTGEVYRVVMGFSGSTRIFGPYYDEDDAVSALLYKVGKLNEIGLINSLQFAEIIIEEDIKRWS